MQEQTIILLCFAAAGFGAEPATQMATLRRRGDGEFMSWRWEKLGEAFEAVFAANTRESQSLAVSRAKHANGDIRGGAY